MCQVVEQELSVYARQEAQESYFDSLGNAGDKQNNEYYGEQDTGCNTIGIFHIVQLDPPVSFRGAISKSHRVSASTSAGVISTRYLRVNACVTCSMIGPDVMRVSMMG